MDGSVECTMAVWDEDRMEEIEIDWSETDEYVSLRWIKRVAKRGAFGEHKKSLIRKSNSHSK
jgi:hypothetical protein